MMVLSMPSFMLLKETRNRGMQGAAGSQGWTSDPPPTSRLLRGHRLQEPGSLGSAVSSLSGALEGSPDAWWTRGSG